MAEIMKKYPDIGIAISEVLLPRPGIDLSRWAVVACDQYTSEPGYWQDVERNVGDAPSTLNLFLPEIYLGKPGEAERVQRSKRAMQAYIDQGLLEPFEGLIYVERSVAGHTRRGLMLCLDLECYDYSKSSQSLIRATEGTMFERVLPRMRIREGAALEVPHILVLIDDPRRTVIEPVGEAKDRLLKSYDFDLMKDGGHLAGYKVDSQEVETGVINALRNLAQPDEFASKYGIPPKTRPVLLFAMGDGNHSLATAKAIWEKLKPQVGPDHPARYALVEIENVHDEGLDFEPIHRVLFGVKQDILTALRQYFGASMRYSPCPSYEDMVGFVEKGASRFQSFGIVCGDERGVAEITVPTANLAVGTLQPFLDEFVMNGGADCIDYIHGKEVLERLGSQEGQVGFYLPKMAKSDLFRTVILDSALPKKTFSMGTAHEKRYYMECRKIC
jgi:hypothetical protein